MSSFEIPCAVCRRLRALFDSFGEADYIGEPVSIIEHSLQCAALAATYGDDELVVSALLHDLGHPLGMEAGFEL